MELPVALPVQNLEHFVKMDSQNNTALSEPALNDLRRRLSHMGHD